MEYWANNQITHSHIDVGVCSGIVGSLFDAHGLLFDRDVSCALKQLFSCYFPNWNQLQLGDKLMYEVWLVPV